MTHFARLAPMLVGFCLVACGGGDMDAPDAATTFDSGRDAGTVADTGTIDAAVIDAHSGTDMGVVDDAGVDAAAADANLPDAGAPAETLSFDISFPVATGEELVRCIVVEAGRASARQIGAFRTTLTNGYEMSVARTTQPLSSTPGACAGASGVSTLILYAQAPTTALMLPTEASFALSATEHLQIQLHAVNQGLASATATGHVELDLLAQAVALRAPASLFVGYDLNISIPPAGSATEASFYALGAGTHAFAVSTGTRALATEATVRQATSAADTTGAIVVDTTDWQHPSLQVLTPPLIFTATNGLRTACSYINPSGRTVRFGLSYTDETCLLLAYTY